MGYNYKDVYYDNLGNDIEYVFFNSFRFLTTSRLSGGSGTRENPATSMNVVFPGNSALHCILDGGYHHRVSVNFRGGTGSNNDVLSGFVGLDKNVTKLKLTGSILINGSSGGTYRPNLYFKDLELIGGNLNVDNTNGASGIQIRFKDCIVSSNLTITGRTSVLTNREASNCIFKNEDISFITTRSRISYLNALTNGNFASLSAYEKCGITITQSTLTSNYNNYLSFDNCRFKFPSDTEYIALNGNTPEELRNDFITRCDANGLAYNTFTEYGFVDMPLGRWLFTKGDSSEAVIYKNSEIDKFETARGIRLGFSNNRPTKIAISNTVNLPSSINPDNPNSGGLEFNEGSITFPNSLDITKEEDFYVTSNIIPLNGIRKINEIICPNSLEWKYGFLIDAEKNIDLNDPILPGQNKIETGVSYLVRSMNNNFAAALYDGTIYNSSLASPRTNIIIGADSTPSFRIEYGHPVLYKILDNRQYQSVQVRIVNKIPDEQITEGNLIASCWYLVEHDTDQANTTDYIEYRGVKYPPLASFLVDNSNLSFSKTGNIHLRRCWRNNFDYNTETTDKAFWANGQKPKWINVNPDDMYCLMKSNNGNENEMQTDYAGNYITSGHPDFYSMVLGSGGIDIPKFPIRGAYMQLRIPMSTLNIM